MTARYSFLSSLTYLSVKSSYDRAAYSWGLEKEVLVAPNLAL